MAMQRRESDPRRGRRSLTPLTELGVADAHALLVERLGQTDVPPLASLEHEDWGRDYLLARLADLSDDQLAAVGIARPAN
jgi:hypothetical protein